MVTEKTGNLILQILDNQYLVAKDGYSKVIFEEVSSNNNIVLDSRIQSTCKYDDFIDAIDYITSYLFSNKDINEVFIKRPYYDKDLFIKDGYDFVDDFIIKLRKTKKI